VTAWATVAAALATLFGAIATFLAVVAALAIAIWGDWLKSLTSRPKLAISISMSAPDCHKIQTTQQLVGPGGQMLPVAAFDTYYCRLSVGNDGNAPARDVGVRAIKLSRLDPKSGEYIVDPHFMAMDLTWAHAGGKVTVAKIDPRLPKHCDLAHVDHSNTKFLQFNTEVTPNEVAPGVWPTVKPAGTYRLEVAATADNAKPLYRTLKIVFGGTWYATEKDMFSKGLTIEVETIR
jgi:hypothetical protein